MPKGGVSSNRIASAALPEHFEDFKAMRCVGKRDSVPASFTRLPGVAANDKLDSRLEKHAGMISEGHGKMLLPTI